MTTLEPKTNVRTVRPGATRRVPAPGGFTAAQPRSLVQAVEAAVNAVDGNALRSVAPHDAGLASQPKALLALLSYCYARQTYGSTDVVNWLRRDANFRQLCRDEFPDVRILRRFRRDNREALHRCLTAALRFLAEQKVAAGFVTRVHEAQLAEEASRRIIMALFVDSMELDADQACDAPVDLCYLFANGRAQVH